jgi:hypothetical protein
LIWGFEMPSGNVTKIEILAADLSRIIDLYKKGTTAKELAEEYGVSLSFMSKFLFQRINMLKRPH